MAALAIASKNLFTILNPPNSADFNLHPLTYLEQADRMEPGFAPKNLLTYETVIYEGRVIAFRIGGFDEFNRTFGKTEAEGFDPAFQDDGFLWYRSLALAAAVYREITALVWNHDRGREEEKTYHLLDETTLDLLLNHPQYVALKNSRSLNTEQIPSGQRFNFKVSFPAAASKSSP